MMKYQLKVTVNSRIYDLAVSSKTTLAELLREDLGLTGTKIGCGEGECGVCTVILDGARVCSCCVLALEADGCEVTTIEGIAVGPELHPIQQAFVEKGAVQCGFCTPGAVLSAKALLDRSPRPGEEEIRAALAGNLCRCTGYQKIVEAVEAAADSIARGE